MGNYINANQTMNYSIASYIGQEVRRFAFLIKGGENFYNLFTLLEAVLPDMADFDAYPLEENKPFCKFDKKAPGSEDKIFLSIDRVVFTEEMLTKPWENMVIDGNVIKTDIANFQWAVDNPKQSVLIPLHEEHDKCHELVDMLPKRQCAAYINYCKPESLPKNCILSSIAGNTKLRKQIKNLSTIHLGYDLTLHSNFYGSYVFTAYNPIYRQIELVEDSNASGIYCRIAYRPNRKELLTFRIKAYNSDRQTVGQYVRNTQCAFLSHFIFDSKFHSLDIDVYDHDDILVDEYTNITFVHKIFCDIDVAEKRIEYHDKQGNVRIVEKYSNAANSHIGADEIHTLFGTSEEYNYDKFEKSLDFVFFDGDKEHQQENRQKAQECILRILNSARKTCYIGDIFFNINSFVDYITPIKRLDLDVRIISSKEKNNTSELNELKQVIEDHNKRIGTRIAFRVMKGKAALHDRFIITDEKMWMLGCSLNEFGVRATTLIRVPQAYANKMIQTAEYWWNNDELTEMI